MVRGALEIVEKLTPRSADAANLARTCSASVTSSAAIWTGTALRGAGAGHLSELLDPTPTTPQPSSRGRTALSRAGLSRACNRTLQGSDRGHREPPARQRRNHAGELFAMHQSPYQLFLIASLYERSDLATTQMLFTVRALSGQDSRGPSLAAHDRDHPRARPPSVLLASTAGYQSLFFTKQQVPAARLGLQPPELLARLSEMQAELEEKLEEVRREIRHAFPAYAEVEYPDH